MVNQAFDFERFKELYNPAISGLQDSNAAVKGIIPQVREVAKQTGSAKLNQTTESFVQVAEEQSVCFQSVEESGEEVKNIYSKYDESVN
jgi:hypothetical protein